MVGTREKKEAEKNRALCSWLAVAVTELNGDQKTAPVTLRGETGLPAVCINSAEKEKTGWERRRDDGTAGVWACSLLARLQKLIEFLRVCV